MENIQYLDIDEQGKILLSDETLRWLGKERGGKVALIHNGANLLLADDLYVTMHRKELDKRFEERMTPEMEKLLNQVQQNRERKNVLRIAP